MLPHWQTGSTTHRLTSGRQTSDRFRSGSLLKIDAPIGYKLGEDAISLEATLLRGHRLFTRPINFRTSQLLESIFNRTFISSKMALREYAPATGPVKQ